MRTRLAILPALIVAAAWGCGRQPPAVTTNLVLSEQDAQWKRTLDDAERAEVLAAFQTLAGGREASEVPHPGAGGLRWSDVERAVSGAAAQIEAAVVQTEREDDGRRLRFRLVTVEDWPGELLVRRVDGPEVYEAEAWIGRFRDRVKRRDDLLEALHAQMEQLGRLRRFDD